MFGSGPPPGTYRTTRLWRLPPRVVDRTRIRASTRPSRAARTSAHRSIATATGPRRARRNRRTARPPISDFAASPISIPPRPDGFDDRINLAVMPTARPAAPTSALGFEQCRAQLVDLLIVEPHVTSRQLDPSLGETVRLRSLADPQADATDASLDANENTGLVDQDVLAGEQQQRGWLLAQRLPAL